MSVVGVKAEIRAGQASWMRGSPARTRLHRALHRWRDYWVAGAAWAPERVKSKAK